MPKKLTLENIFLTDQQVLNLIYSQQRFAIQQKYNVETEKKGFEQLLNNEQFIFKNGKQIVQQLTTLAEQKEQKILLWYRLFGAWLSTPTPTLERDLQRILQEVEVEQNNFRIDVKMIQGLESASDHQLPELNSEHHSGFQIKNLSFYSKEAKDQFLNKLNTVCPVQLLDLRDRLANRTMPENFFNHRHLATNTQNLSAVIEKPLTQSPALLENSENMHLKGTDKENNPANPSPFAYLTTDKAHVPFAQKLKTTQQDDESSIDKNQSPSSPFEKYNVKNNQDTSSQNKGSLSLFHRGSLVNNTRNPSNTSSNFSLFGSGAQSTNTPPLTHYINRAFKHSR